jgi:hypothetical protein
MEIEPKEPKKLVSWTTPIMWKYKTTLKRENYFECLRRRNNVPYPYQLT